jgi:hypothetical protein
MPCDRVLGMHWNRSWVGPKAGLDAFEEEKSLAHAGNQTLFPVIEPLYKLSYLDIHYICIYIYTHTHTHTHTVSKPIILSVVVQNVNYTCQKMKCSRKICRLK